MLTRTVNHHLSLATWHLLAKDRFPDTNASSRKNTGGAVTNGHFRTTTLDLRLSLDRAPPPCTCAGARDVHSPSLGPALVLLRSCLLGFLYSDAELGEFL